MTKAYNENDGYVGFWIKDTPYEVSRAIEITPETGIRVYLGYKRGCTKRFTKEMWRIRSKLFWRFKGRS